MAEFLNNGLDQARIFWASETRKKMMSFRSPLEILGENPTVLLLEATFFVWATLTLKHGESNYIRRTMQATVIYRRFDRA